jgi:hypothetical protein
MPFDLRRFPAFDRLLQETLKKYPLSLPNISRLIDSLPVNYQEGEVYPGFGGLQVRKLRLPLKEYGLGKRKGLRLLCLVAPEKGQIVPLMIYKKGEFASESKVVAEARKLLAALLSELAPR